MRNSTLVIILTHVLLYSTNAFAESPTTQIKSTVDQVIQILADPQLQGEIKKEERHKLLRKTIFPRFDFAEMAKRSLGAHWRRRTAEEQVEFVRIFTDLLERDYLDKIESYTNEKFIYTEERIDGPYAEVGSKILTSGGEEFNILYKVHLIEKEWKIYDLVVENISLVNNYRSQFNRIITRSTYDELVSKMKQKLSDRTDQVG